MSHSLFIKPHAIDRYIERVDPTATRQEAACTIRAIHCGGRARPKPRKWTGVTARPGTRYVYSAQHPGICVVERGGVIRTVFARQTSRQWRAQQRRMLTPQAA
jgi:hypothetical protein